MTYTTYRGGASEPRLVAYHSGYDPFHPVRAKQTFGFNLAQSAEYGRLYWTGRRLAVIDGGGAFLAKFERSGFIVRAFRHRGEAERFAAQWQARRRD